MNVRDPSKCLIGFLQVFSMASREGSLQDLVKSSSFVILEASCSRRLATSNIRDLCKQKSRVILVQLDPLEHDRDVEEQHLLDYWSGHCGLIPSLSTVSADVASAAAPAEASSSPSGRRSRPLVVFLSLTPLVLAHGLDRSARLVSSLLDGGGCDVAAVLVRGCHQERELAWLRTRADAWIRLEEEGRRTVLKARGRKVKEVIVARKAESGGEKEEEVLATTTFRLDLSEKEREARDKLVLPFLREKQQEETEDEGVRIQQQQQAKDTTTCGKIYYSPEEVDDWDEEDPDDDLDF